MQELYPYIFKRKSFHRFGPFEPFTPRDKALVIELFASVVPLDASIKTKLAQIPDPIITRSRPLPVRYHLQAY